MTRAQHGDPRTAARAYYTLDKTALVASVTVTAFTTGNPFWAKSYFK